MFKSIRLSLILVISGILLISGAVFGQSVGPDGSLNYSYEIKLPPGTNGMAPKLALVYNSNSPNGMMGIGWSMAGLPVITRDSSFGIRYDGTDRYVGQSGRLVLHENNIYHYEYETFSKVEAKNGTPGNPDYWVETTSDGTQYYFGSTADSAKSKAFANINGVDTTNVRVWALSKVVDIHGNYYTVQYMNDQGEIYPTSIKYTQGNGLSNFRYVNFSYDLDVEGIGQPTRTDINTSYAQSAKVVTAKRLSKIELRVDPIVILGFTFGGLTRTYLVGYAANDPNGVTPSRIVKLHEHGADGSELPVTGFEWNT